jgi:hypothetical protein
MPLENEQDLARLYATMLAQQTPPTYDDGASLMQRNPMMMDIGLFGKGPKPKPVAPPVDIQRRRLMGLSDTPPQPKQELPMQTPSAANLPAPVQAPMPSQSPLSAAYKALTTPMSRRQFLGNTARTAGQMALRGALPELAKLAEPIAKPPLEQIVPKVNDYQDMWNNVSNALYGKVENMDSFELLDAAKSLLTTIKAKKLIPTQDLAPFRKDFNRLRRRVEPDAEELGQLIQNLYDELPKEHVLSTFNDAGLPIKTGDIVAEDIQYWARNHEDAHAADLHDFLRRYHPHYNEESLNERIPKYLEEPSFIHDDIED